MIRRNQETRYRSFKYVSSTTNLMTNNHPLKLNFKAEAAQPSRLSLNKENTSQPVQFRIRAQTPKLKQRKPQSEWCQNKIYNANSTLSQTPHLFLCKRNQQSFDKFQPDILMPKSLECPPYQEYFDQLQNQLDLCGSRLDQQKSNVGQLRNELMKIKVNVDKSLREAQQMLQKEINRFKQFLGGSLKEHNKIVVNSKQKILLTQQIYAQTFQEMDRISSHLSQMDDSFNF